MKVELVTSQRFLTIASYRVKKILEWLVVVVMTLIFAEVGLQAASFYIDPNSRLYMALEPALRYKGDLYWKELFVEHYASRSNMFGCHEPDPLLGWVPVKNLRVVENNKTYTINDIGARVPRPFQRDERHYLVLAFGDSFTFGSDADDTMTWRPSCRISIHACKSSTWESVAMGRTRWPCDLNSTSASSSPIRSLSPVSKMIFIVRLLGSAILKNRSLRYMTMISD